MRRVLFAVAVAVLSVVACKPIERPHTYSYDFPPIHHDFLVRWIGTPGGVAVWISTADDLETNGRYEGVNFLVDPGSPTDVENVVLPYLAKNGVPAHSPVAYVVLTNSDAQAMSGAQRVAKEFTGVEIVSAARMSVSAKGKPVPAPSSLQVGPEISARLLRPDGVAGLDAQALLLRFIDSTLLFLPSHSEGLADTMGRSIGEKLETEGLHVTLTYAANGRGLTEQGLEHLQPEVVVGAGSGAATVNLAAPKSGEVLEVGTNGSEVKSPGPVTRSRFGHWIDCSKGGATCGADLTVPASGPLLVPVKLAGQDEGLFLVDTRAPFSYLVRPRFEKIPGWEKAKHAGHSHGGGAIGLEVPPFTITGGGRSVDIHRWHVLAIAPFQVGGKDIAGVIGLDLLQSFRLDYLPKEKRLSLTPNFDEPREHLVPAEQKTAAGIDSWDIPMDHSPKGPLILSTMDRDPKSLIVDLAAERTRVYIRPDAWAKVTAPSAQDLWLFDVPDEIDQAAWKKWELAAGTLPVKELNLFGAKFKDTPALAIDRPLETDVIGLDFLRTFDKVSMDFRRRSIVLETRSP